MKSAFVTIMVCLLITMSWPDDTNNLSPVKSEIVFEGTVLNLSPPVALSGRVSTYRLVKYRVERVCRGKYERADIVVDHLIVTGRELEGIKAGDKVWLTVNATKKISPRYDADGIRDKAEAVDVFYVAKKLSRIPPSVCSLNR